MVRGVRLSRVKSGVVAVLLLSSFGAALGASPAQPRKLYRIGMLERTSRGRKATRKAYEHLGKTMPTDNNPQATLV